MQTDSASAGSDTADNGRDEPTGVVSGNKRPRWVASAVGLVSSAVALGVAQFVAALLAPSGSPVVAIGSSMIDLAPRGVKDFAIENFGENDKFALSIGVIAVLIPLSALIGVVAFRRIRVAYAMVAALGVLGAVAAMSRPDAAPASLLPAVVTVVVGVIALRTLVNASTSNHDAGSPDAPDTPSTPNATRRNVLIGAAAGGAVVTLGAGIAVDRLTKSDDALGRNRKLPAPADPAPAVPAGVHAKANTATPWLTKNSKFYRVDTAFKIPRINAKTWRLTVNGMVDKKISLSYDDLLAMPLVERNITLACVSNPVGGPYISNGTWIGVRLTDILDKAGVRSTADQLFSTSTDGWSASTPLATVTDGRDAMIAVGLNGQQLAFERGFPARMLVPGLYGFVSGTKWLTNIELTTFAKAKAYWTERGWDEKSPIFTESRIDVPKAFAQLPSGKVTVAGVAWAQTRGISKVEVRDKNGDWKVATLAADGGKDVWRQWSVVLELDDGRHDIQVRATDMTGMTQTDQRADPFPKGATGWHTVTVTCA